MLPSEGPIRFAKEQDFLASFRYEVMNPFHRFVEDWDNPAHEFNDIKLEGQRKALLRACTYFAEAVALKTAPRTADLQSVVPRHMESDGPFPEWVKRDARDIRAAARAVVDEHKKMMRMGRSKLPLQ